MLYKIILILCTLALLLPVRGESVEITEETLPFVAKPVLKWSVRDVELWMNYTVGYAEYSAYLRKNLVDGVTLLEMEAADFESYLPIQSPLHSIKIGAHLKLLKGLCTCRASESVTSDFWSYMRQYPKRTWILGATANFFPRTAMLSAYLFDHDLYLDMVGVEASPEELLAAANKGDGELPQRKKSWVQVALYWISWVVAPDLYMAYRTARLTPGNYIVMPLLVIHFLSRALGEYFLIFLIYSGQAFPPGKSLLAKIRMLYSYSLLAPLVGVILAFLPVSLQYIATWIFVLHNLFYLVMSLFLGDTEVGKPYDEEQARKEAEAAAENTEAAAPTPEAFTSTTEEKERLDKLD
ncbi:hypothetical protein AGDE_06209 [Angomonas deanei]|uniref:SAM domain (Sterile alpha motif), putative n=1 Tax=Angomonas deanei TaxID=59799 RepID=A0A7G2CEF4_9TRYP|nr:hypothetical protein AGDE_06209 [Angomonas deanei]CAD2218258.1 SAM domain (Sterile alpha motif), putative [Angomonas deanei]|eukprot:EPY37725.1 hypothetical protein AGDE_06209 [Angomonas deanei]